MSVGVRKIRGYYIVIWKFPQRSSLMWESLGTDAIMFDFQVDVSLKYLYERRNQLRELNRGCLFPRNVV